MFHCTILILIEVIKCLHNITGKLLAPRNWLNIRRIVKIFWTRLTLYDKVKKYISETIDSRGQVDVNFTDITYLGPSLFILFINRLH